MNSFHFIKGNKICKYSITHETQYSKNDGIRSIKIAYITLRFQILALNASNFLEFLLSIRSVWFYMANNYSDLLTNHLFRRELN